MSRALRMAQRAKNMFEQADIEGRELSGVERAEAQRLLDDAKSMAATEKQVREIGELLGAPAGDFFTDPNSWAGRAAGGPGDIFIRSKGWQQIADPGHRPQSWSTGAVEIPPFPHQLKAYGAPGYQTKAGTLLSSGQGSGLIPVPDVLPGVVTTLFQPLGVADVFAQSQTTSNSVRYIIEGTATNSVAGVAEGGEKPASDLALSTKDEPVKKLATVLTISDELLEDGPSVQGYLNGRLTLFTRLREETSLLRGAGTNDLVGIMDSSRGINLYAKQAGDDNAVCLARVLANTAGSSYLTPDCIVMHPTNFLSTRLLRDSTGGTIGGYLGTGPFGMSYGNQGAPGLFGQELWGTRVVLSTIVGAGTALVGSFQQGARIVRRGGPTIEITNSHSDYFVFNLAMIRAESRLGLCLFRPAAFTEVRGLS